MTAVMCLHCSAILYWDAHTHGTRLKDYKCPKCGGRPTTHKHDKVRGRYTDAEWYSITQNPKELPAVVKKVNEEAENMVRDSAELALGDIEWKILNTVQKQAHDYPTLRELSVLTTLDISVIIAPIRYLVSREVLQSSHSPDHGGEKVYLITKAGETAMAMRRPDLPKAVIEAAPKAPTLSTGQTHTSNATVKIQSPLNPPERPFKCEYPECGCAFTTHQGLSHHKTAQKHWNGAKGVVLMPLPETEPVAKPPPVQPVVIPPVQPDPKPAPLPVAEERKFKCSVPGCYVSCATEARLNNHRSTIHRGLCDVCERDFGEVDRMLVHKGLMHDPRLLAPHAVINILDILRSESVAQIDIVKADLEIIDKRGHEYQVSINRVNKGLILTKDTLKDVVSMLETQREISEDMLNDEDEDERAALQAQIESATTVIKKICREAGIEPVYIKTEADQ